MERDRERRACQADLLLGGRPVPGSREWTAEQEDGTGAQREVAAQTIRFRIELEIGIDSCGR
ncbi:hypothetical protein [Micromonospora sp. NPDC049679]|uniref:hypothetical protein n=1 Tax=Micromonospora sp. NPDC049679 TaxID=3155920 RepID=UPI0033D852A9